MTAVLTFNDIHKF